MAPFLVCDPPRSSPGDSKIYRSLYHFTYVLEPHLSHQYGLVKVKFISLSLLFIRRESYVFCCLLFVWHTTI